MGEKKGGWKDRRKQRSTHNHTRNVKDQSIQMPIPIPELPGCLIQNQDLGILQQCPSNGNSGERERYHMRLNFHGV